MADEIKSEIEDVEVSEADYTKKLKNLQSMKLVATGLQRGDFVMVLARSPESGQMVRYSSPKKHKVMPKVRGSVGKTNVMRSTKIPASVIINGKRYKKTASFYDDPNGAKYAADQYKASGFLAVVRRYGDYHTVYFAKKSKMVKRSSYY